MRKLKEKFKKVEKKKPSKEKWQIKKKKTKRKKGTMKDFSEKSRIKHVKRDESMGY